MSQTPKRPNLFGMVTTAASRHYTPLALRSFFTHTPLGPQDHLLLIDNDGDFELPAGLPHAALTVVRPGTPQGFATNGNLLLREARTRGADLFFMNNDLVFTAGWLEPLLADRRALLSPLSNAQVAGSAAGFSTQPCMDLEDYAGHEAAVDAIAAQLRAQADGYSRTPTVAFFCIKIPKAVYDVVGDFDESFGKGGGEDRDYAVRAWISGIPQEFALQSYVLHFQGRSTWRGAETPEQRKARDAQYVQAFEAKWGPALTYAFLRGDWNLFRTDAAIAAKLAAGDYSTIVRRLRSRPALEPFVTRQRNARFDACVVADDDSGLPSAVESVYAACGSIWFLVGEQDPHGLVECIQGLADPDGKFKIVRGDWPGEAARRNAGLTLMAEAGADYCFVLDAGEIYDPAQLQEAMAVVRENPQVDCWRVSCLTETSASAVFARVGTGQFVEPRTFQAPRHVTLPRETVVFRRLNGANRKAS
jgi:GT2 family glycosyltransferase